MNRFLLYIGAVLFLSLVGLSVYVFLLRQDTFHEVPQEEIVIPDSNASVFDPNAPYAQVSAKETVEVGVTDNGDVVAVFGSGSVAVFDEQGALKQEFSSGLSPVVRAVVSPKGEAVSMLVLQPETHTSRWYRWEYSAGSPSALNQDIDDIFYSPDGTPTRVYTSAESTETRFVVEQNGREQTILTSRIPDVRAHWTDSSHLLLTTLPSGEAHGIAYLFNTRTRGTQRILGGRYGLSAIGAGTSVLFSETTARGNRTMETSLYSAGKESELSFFTLPERCVVEGAGSFVCSSIASQGTARVMPDDYLMGKVINGSSNIYRIDAQTGLLSALASVPFDATRPAVSQGGNFIFVIDKNSGSLWRVRVD